MSARPVFDIEYLFERRGAASFELEGFALGPSERLAVIGANGAGKTTLIEGLLGLRGARVEGRAFGEPWKVWARSTADRRSIGAQLQNVSYPGASTVRDIVRLHRALFGRQSPAVHGALAVEELSAKRYSRLSKGERQRVDLFLALAHEPCLTVLDEPFSGLDVRYQAALARLLAARSGAMLMICHSAQEIALADTVAWIERGRVRAREAPQSMRRRLVGDARLHLDFIHESAAHEALAALTAEAAILRIERPTTAALTIYGDGRLAELAKALTRDGQVQGFAFTQTTLADLLQFCSRTPS